MFEDRLARKLEGQSPALEYAVDTREHEVLMVNLECAENDT